jgi:hypothetical protein
LGNRARYLIGWLVCYLLGAAVAAFLLLLPALF